MKICVIGTGYVGLVAGTCFAESGNDVACVDIDEKKIQRLREGHVPIYEPGLEELIQRNVEEGRLTFTTDVASAVRQSQVCFIAVGTPQGDNELAPDMRFVYQVARDIGTHMDGYRVVVLKSTVPVGTAQAVRKILDETTRHPYDVVSNPEFMKEGAAVEDFLKPDRVVIGVASDTAADIMKDLYAPFVRGGAPILVMDNPSAEMTKYAANALLATKISFINEVANLCEKVGADVSHVRQGVGTDRRLGMHFLYPGLGYGGSCFPKDVRAIMHTAQSVGLDFPLMNAVDDVNNRQKKRLFEKITQYYGGNLSGRTFGVWGLAFKPRTDDMREAPSIGLVNDLLAAGCKVNVHDPEAMEVARGCFGDRVTYCSKNYDALSGADALCVVTEWNEFRHPDFDRIKRLLKEPVVFDGRNLWEPRDMKSRGFVYFPIGRAAALPE
ncbi:MAG TPA: UDP-glucose/GDP-mannose dehydrogenase family protein [Candidatus Limnocylindrales bacterium]|nr:UDP-glucose/GDP-mannose dehydrogenase family protein [Candidatus Limnocylindrales bacterium]